jgi:hypothetical protein
MCDFIPCNKIMLLSPYDKKVSNVLIMNYVGNSPLTYTSWISHLDLIKNLS